MTLKETAFSCLKLRHKDIWEGGGIHTFITSGRDGDEGSTFNCSSPSPQRKFQWQSERRLARLQSRLALCHRKYFHNRRHSNSGRPAGSKSLYGKLIVVAPSIQQKHFKLTTVQTANVSMQLASLSIAWISFLSDALVDTNPRLHVQTRGSYNFHPVRVQNRQFTVKLTTGEQQSFLLHKRKINRMPAAPWRPKNSHRKILERKARI